MNYASMNHSLDFGIDKVYFAGILEEVCLVVSIS